MHTDIVEKGKKDWGRKAARESTPPNRQKGYIQHGNENKQNIELFIYLRSLEAKKSGKSQRQET